MVIFPSSHNSGDAEIGSGETCSGEQSFQRPNPLKRRSSTTTKLPETSETKGMSNDELHRLVLLEQLSYIRMKKQHFMDISNTSSPQAPLVCDPNYVTYSNQFTPICYDNQ